VTHLSKAKYEAEAIAKKLVELLGVEVHVESVVGSEARYTFTLPLSDDPLKRIQNKSYLLIHQLLESSHSQQSTIPLANAPVQQLSKSSVHHDIPRASFEDLKLESTLQDLFLHEFQIELSCTGEELAAAFDNNPMLPGAILTDDGHFKGRISRQRFLKTMSRPYARELFFHAPLSRLYPYVETDVLVFHKDTPIDQAASQCLQRPREILTEPLVVEFDQEVYKLLDVHQVLVAQAQIHKLATQLIQKQADQLTQAKKALDDELEKGRQIQIDFLPAEIPQVPNLEIAKCFHPARQVAGDFYDAFMLPGDYLGLVISDVCDKGVGAALFMALFRSLIRVFSGQTSLYDLSIALNHKGLEDRVDVISETDLDQISALQAVEFTNDYITQNHAQMSMFATLFFGVYNPLTNSLIYINAGHEPLFIVSSQGVKQKLKPTGPAVGMMPNTKFKIKQVQIDPGDILIGYTDGVTEARAPNGEFFTLQRLVALLEKPAQSVHDLLERVREHLFTHIDDAPQFDDITMLAVQRIF
jgi:serine phosphatase RsbU (regulator of sigma subunit)